MNEFIPVDVPDESVRLGTKSLRVFHQCEKEGRVHSMVGLIGWLMFSIRRCFRIPYWKRLHKRSSEFIRHTGVSSSGYYLNITSIAGLISWFTLPPPHNGGHSHIWTIWVCTTPRGRVFEPFWSKWNEDFHILVGNWGFIFWRHFGKLPPFNIYGRPFRASKNRYQY